MNIHLFIHGLNIFFLNFTFILFVGHVLKYHFRLMTLEAIIVMVFASTAASVAPLSTANQLALSSMQYSL